MTDPPSLNHKTKSLTCEKNIAFKRFRSDRCNTWLRRQLNFPQDHLNDSIEDSKKEY